MTAGDAQATMSHDVTGPHQSPPDTAEESSSRKMQEPTLTPSCAAQSEDRIDAADERVSGRAPSVSERDHDRAPSASEWGHDGPPSAAAPNRTARERLGPVLIVSPLRRRAAGRFWAIVIAAVCFGVLGFAATLHPRAEGLGTHTQFGLPTCGFLMQTGYPCPTCGMTTAFAHLVRGHPLRSFLDQPTGFVLGVATAIVGVVALAAAVSGRAVWVNWYRVNPVRMVWGFLILFFASWAFKIILGLANGTLPAR